MNSPPRAPELQDDPIAKKARLRSQIRAARAALSPEERARRDQHIHEVLLAQLAERFRKQRPTLAAYCAMRGEPGGQELPEMLATAGFPVLLPVVHNQSRELQWRYYKGREHLRANSMGILEPTGEATGPLEQLAALAVLPALAVGADGTRLGQGGGFYDKQFSRAAARPSAIWALVDDAELLDSVPALEHDLKVDAAISPRGATAFPRRAIMDDISLD